MVMVAVVIHENIDGARTLNSKVMKNREIGNGQKGVLEEGGDSKSSFSSVPPSDLYSV
jgi:hypothetical protein